MAIHHIDIHVGTRIRTRRKMLGISQPLLGKSIGVTFQQIQKYERGANRVGSSRLYLLAHALGVQVSYFFEGLTDPQAPVAHHVLSSITAHETAVELRRLAQRIEDELAA